MDHRGHVCKGDYWRASWLEMGAAIVKKQRLPYIFRFNNVLDEYSKSSMHCLLHLVKTIINLINSEKRLPKILLIIPDRDLLTQLRKINADSAMVIGASLHYIIKQIDLANSY